MTLRSLIHMSRSVNGDRENLVNVATPKPTKGFTQNYQTLHGYFL